MGGWGECGSRWTLAVLLGCIALLAGAPTALAAEGTGKISGTVTEAASPFKGLEKIEIAVYETGENLFPVGSAITNEHGEYTIVGLASGSYKVEFSPEFESGLNYVTQYYKDKSSLAMAEPVAVVQGKTTEPIDATLQVGGKIEGTVMSACECEDFNLLKNIEVTAYEAGGSEFPVGYATTNAGGKYTIIGLATGSYKVRFSAGVESGLNFVTQYYKDQLSLETAGSVKVEQEKTTTAINAELQVGGEISGTVTDAWTHASLSNVYVFAIGSDEAFAGVAQTNASGQYTMLGLATGVYEIEFVDLGSGSPYITQYYNDEPSLASAIPVTANQGSTTTEIDAALVRKAPVNTAAPVASGTPAAGQTLSCSNGSWMGEPKPTFTHTWLRNGSAIAGSTASTYVVQTADQGTGLACRVTATNKNGSASAVSNTLMVPVAPPPPRPRPEVKLLGAKIVVSRSSAHVPIACVNANCTGTIELIEQVVVRHRHHGRRISKRETLVLGKGSYALAAGHSATILVHLTSRGKNALAKARHHRLSAKLFASVTGGATVSRSVVLSEAVHRHRRR